MSFIATSYTIIAVASLLVCFFSILLAVVKKKFFMLILALMWFGFVLTSFGLTWMYYQDYNAALYSGFGGEIRYVFDGIGQGDLLSKIVLGINVSIVLVAFAYLIYLIRKTVIGIRKAAISTSQYVKDKYHAIKEEIRSFFKKEDQTELVSKENETEEEPKKETP